MEKNLSDIEALALEKELISRYGQVNLDTGTLFNLSSGGSGTSYRMGEPIEIDGVVYPSKRAAARAYDVNDVTFLNRSKKGWTPEQAVGKISPPPRKRPEGKSIFCEGIKYVSLTRFAQAFDKPRELVKQRLKRGWTLEQAVELSPAPTGSNVPKQVTCMGRKFRSVTALAKHYNEPLARVRRLLKAGHSPEIAVRMEALPGEIICDGERFKSIRALARRYGTVRETIRRRRKQGLTWEKAVREDRD